MDQPQSSRAEAQPRADEDLRLIARIRARDLGAFEALYRCYHPRLTRFLIQLIRRPRLVEEVLDDTLMAVWRRPEGFNGTSKLSTWIFAIAYRQAMKALRRYDDPVEDDAAELRPSPDPGPEDEAAHGRLKAMLAEAIAELSPDHRAVVDLTYFHELGYREIAEIMGCPVDTVKTRMFHARRHLRRKLDGGFADWI